MITELLRRLASMWFFVSFCTTKTECNELFFQLIRCVVLRFAFPLCIYFMIGENREMEVSGKWRRVPVRPWGFIDNRFLAMACFVFRERGRIIAEKVTCERKKTFDKT